MITFFYVRELMSIHKDGEVYRAVLFLSLTRQSLDLLYLLMCIIARHLLYHAVTKHMINAAKDHAKKLLRFCHTLSAAIRSRISGLRSSSAGSIPAKDLFFSRLDRISRCDNHEYQRLTASFAIKKSDRPTVFLHLFTDSVCWKFHQ